MTGRRGVAQRKEALRGRMRRVRAAIPPPERARLSAQVEEALFALPEIAAARTVLLFYSFGSEVATRGMVARAVAGGARMLLPYLAGGVMEATEVRPGDELAPTAFGPKEPGRRTAIDPEEIDVVVAPGLAFDRTGRRLGYGGGHYDRYLDRLGRHARTVGIGFSAQLVDEVPAGRRDRRVELVVTDAGVIDCRPVQ
ncbi:MAG: 5-formyltetrahydrofolate cyclo-ligase [Actinomycetota bacterium]